jgi:hypothetical protein
VFDLSRPVSVRTPLPVCLLQAQKPPRNALVKTQAHGNNHYNFRTVTTAVNSRQISALPAKQSRLAESLDTRLFPLEFVSGLPYNRPFPIGKGTQSRTFRI